jgi:TatD DNase family protein
MPDPSFPDLIDYHCHLDLYPDFEEEFRKCTRNRVATLSVTTTPRAWPKNSELASTSPMVRVGLGLHPQLVGERSHELSLFEKYLPEARYVAEVGLDAGPAHYKSYPQQKVVFETIVRLCAQAGGKILSVHAVRAARDVLRMIEDHLTGTDNRVVLHWFTGSLAEARRAVALGCYFSINQAMFGKPAGVALVAGLPRERLLTETDGPFVKMGSRPATPSDVIRTAENLALVLKLDTAETKDLLRSNLVALEKPGTGSL